MDFSEYYYLVSLLFLGACNGLIFSVILFQHKRGKQVSNRILAVIVFVMSLSLAESVVVLSGLYRSLPHLISTTFPLLFLIGPLFYFYVKTRLGQITQFKPFYLLHLIPFFIAFFDQLPGYSRSAVDKITHLDALLLQESMDISWRIFLMMSFKIIQNGAYIFLAWRALVQFEDSIKDYHSDEAELTSGWIKKFSSWFAGYWALYLIVFVVLSVSSSYSVFIDNVIFLGEAAFVLTVGFYAIRKPEIYSGPILKSMLSEKYEKSSLSEKQTGEYARGLLELMESEKPYLKSDLRLPELAEQLSISTNHLSQILNQELGMSFFDFINEYRVNEAKKNLIHPDFRHLTFLAIAYEAGFSSKASFNRVFKKHTGKTPSSYVSSKQKRQA